MSNEFFPHHHPPRTQHCESGLLFLNMVCLKRHSKMRQLSWSFLKPFWLCNCLAAVKVTQIKHCRLRSTKDLHKDLAITLSGRGSRDSSSKRGGGGGGCGRKRRKRTRSNSNNSSSGARAVLENQIKLLLQNLLCASLSHLLRNQNEVDPWEYCLSYAFF